MRYDDLASNIKQYNKLKAKKIIKKDTRILRDSIISLSDKEQIVKLKVDKMVNDLSKKYKIEEQKIYEELYMKVRKMFLELL